MPRVVQHSHRRVRFTPFPQVPPNPRNTNSVSPLDDFTFSPSEASRNPDIVGGAAYSYVQIDQAVVLAELSDIGHLSPSNGLARSVTNQNDQNQAQRNVIPPRPSIAHIFINNECYMSRSKEWTRVLDPGTQALISKVPNCTHQEVQSAVSAAQAAQPDWEALGFQSRRDYLLKLIDILRGMSDEIIAILSREVGKTAGEAESEVFRGIDCIHAACSIGPEMAGMFLGSDPTILQTFYEPLGVCVTITPFSFPFMTPLWSIPFALATGNTVVLKPSEKAPSVACILSEAVLRAGLPPGIFNLVHGGYSVVQMLILQPLVQAVSFVGSESAAKQVHDISRKAGKRIQAECGGKNHGVVLDDASMMPTLFAIAGSAFGAAGQRCMSLSVAVFVGETREWIPKLVEIAESMIVGYSGDEETKVGPLIDRSAKEKVTGFIDRAVEEGATLLCDGRDALVPGYPDGNFVGPTIITNVETYMECYQSEIYGPVLICMQVDTLEEAIDLINQNKYGNGCSLFTTSGKHAKTFQRAVNVGQIGINIPLIAPYGPAVRTSNKASFMGDRHVPGKTYWPFFTTTKTVSARWDQ